MESHHALIISCKASNTKLAKVLIGKGADVNRRDYRGGSALLYAAKQLSTGQVEHKSTLETIELLLEKGASTEAKPIGEEKSVPSFLQESAAPLLVSASFQWLSIVCDSVINYVEEVRR